MRFLKILGMVILVFAVIIAAAVFILTSSMKKKGLPVYDGTVTLQGLDGEVSVHRDEYGVPHIMAETEHDAYMALGYVHAQERLFQMNNFRLYSQGRLSELPGGGEGPGSTLAQDMFFRAVGLKLMGEKGVDIIDPESMKLLQGYTDGVNAYLADGELPPEFIPRLIEFPTEWKVSDTLSMGRLIAWFLSHNWEREILRQNIINEVGVDRGWAMFPKYPDDGPYIIDPSVKKFEPRGKVIEERPVPVPPEMFKGGVAAAMLRLGDGPLGEIVSSNFGSNNWVVSGDRTVTGNPILSNDPHLQHMLPSIFFQAHLVSKDGLDVIGVTFPGMPFIVLGHNRHIAWGATTTRADCQDLYVEKVNPDNPDEYMHNGEWKKFEKREEVFRLNKMTKFEERKITVRTTVHGPIISDVSADFPKDGPPIALAWTGLMPSNDALGFFNISRAKSAADVKAALAQLGMPIQNWVYADDQGNIGYYASGMYPMRTRGDGTMPVPGWTGDYDWLGLVPVEELPLLENPSNGAIFSANNAVLPERDYSHIVSFQYQLYRAARIKQLLESKDKFSVDDMAAFQHDRHSLQGERLAPVFVSAFEAAGDKGNELAVKAAGILKNWDYQAGVDSAGAAVFYYAYKRALYLTYQDEISHDIFLRLMSAQAMDAVFDNAFESGNSLFFDDQKTEKTESRDEIMARALEEAAAMLKERLGEPEEWRWGPLHRLVFAHPMGTTPVLKKVFPLHLIESAGGRDTVFLSYYLWTQDEFFADGGPCFRQIIDMGDIPAARMIIDTGESGHPSSPHIFDQNDKWLNGEYIPMEMDIEKVKAQQKGTLVLKGKD